MLQRELEVFREVAADWTVLAHGQILAEVLVNVALHREALELVSHLLSIADKIGEGEMRVDLARLRGVLASAEGDRDGAEYWISEAFGAPRRQGPLWWELRAARDLARLWYGQGRIIEARELLAPVYAS